MAQNYQQFSFEIPDLTPEEGAWLKEEHGKTDEDVDDDFLSAFTLIVDPTVAYLFSDSDNGDLERVVTFVQMFLKAHRPDGAIGIEWADWCSKPRTGEFGGGAILVTATTDEWMSTSESLRFLLDKRQAKAPSASDQLEREGPVGSENYTLKDPKTGSGVWIRVKDLMVHVHVTDEGVVTDIYTEGNDSTQDPSISDEAVASTYAYFGEER